MSVKGTGKVSKTANLFIVGVRTRSWHAPLLSSGKSDDTPQRSLSTQLHSYLRDSNRNSFPPPSRFFRSSQEREPRSSKASFHLWFVHAPCSIIIIIRFLEMFE
ncbi:hypothetical protein Agabi119p4_6812 [Agaricus bisporus var. burnettii]|uniref:Uncharacterized protein n=1 Tax=Agaricus bisporus var. burnettii TaxID=192524 RepID=A0A8H7KBX4_AGABI|nr:hypothetical protein Agabi119p4_6812 [Agaricus bisporus var. burnettii]